MSTHADNAYGLASYVATAAQIARRDGGWQPWILARMLLAKALYGLSATEYGKYGLQHKPLRRLGDYQTKKQTTALFERVNPQSLRSQVDDKLLFHRLCVAAGLPVPTLHAILSRRGTVAEDFPVLETFADLQAHFSGEEDLSLILKPQSDSLGTGVRFVRLHHGTAFDLVGAPIPVEAFQAELHADMARDDYLVQAFMRPDPALADMGSGKALGTFRILAHASPGQVRLIYVLARIPCGDNVHDNFSGGQTGNLITSVDPDSGRMSMAYGLRDARFDRLVECFANNPDNGRRIEGVTVPEWASIRALVERAARVFEDLPVLGWDAALTAAGPVIIEANSNPDVIGAQVCMGRGAADLLRL